MLQVLNIFHLKSLVYVSQLYIFFYKYTSCFQYTASSRCVEQNSRGEIWALELVFSSCTVRMSQVAQSVKKKRFRKKKRVKSQVP